MYSHLMTDIETLDTKETGIILSVAMMSFDPTKGMDTATNRPKAYHVELNTNLSIEAQERTGRTMSASTVQWWMQQDAAAQAAAFPPMQSTTGLLVQATKIFSIVRQADHLWANDPDFDYAFLRNFVEQEHRGIYPIRWPFWKHRSYRTINAFAPPEFDKNECAVGTTHNALDDAISQANVVCALWPHFTGGCHG